MDVLAGLLAIVCAALGGSLLAYHRRAQSEAERRDARNEADRKRAQDALERLAKAERDARVSAASAERDKALAPVADAEAALDAAEGSEDLGAVAAALDEVDP